MELNLHGRTALITGGSKGIGLAIARALAAERCNVVLVARGEQGLRDAEAQLRDHPADVRTHAADLAKPEDVAATVARFPDIDILVNNAGAVRRGAIGDIDDAAWRTYWDLKVFGFINLSRAYYACMAEAGRGVILNIIGATADRPDPNHIAGATGNAALVSLTRALGCVSADHGVRIVGISPGPVLTDKLRMSLRTRAQRELGSEDRWSELLAKMPFGRPALLEEIGAAAAFLASDVSGYTTGTVLTIDGGGSNRRAVT